jgi:LmbE family N-acetylglucosaminyl deacetylase
MMDTEPSPQVRYVVLSPHLDDAVLSTWHALVSSGEVRVITVFAGIPEPGFVTALDRTRGATEAAALMKRRREDDRAVLALAGRRPTHADLLEVNYQAVDVPEVQDAIERDPTRYVEIVAAADGLGTPVDAIEEAVGDWLTGDVVYAPLGIGRHPDHRDVARLGLRLARRGRAVRFYADFPYVVRYGLPSWLGGGQNSVRADAQIEDAFAALPAASRDFDRFIVELTTDEVDKKITAFRRYETEFSLVDADFASATSDRERMRREVYWTSRSGSP